MNSPRLAALALALVAAAGLMAAPKPAKATASKTPATPGLSQILSYTHIDGFGTPTPEVAWLAWEFEALDFVKYQVTYTSCTCRPESINKKSLLYIEVTKGGTGGKIRRVRFDYWGDSLVMPDGTTREEIEKKWMPKLPNKMGPGIAAIDTMSGATVTTVNLKQILKAVLEYHDAHYGNSGLPPAPDFVDTVSGATGH